MVRDATRTQTVMTRRRGRAPRGGRLTERVPRTPGENQTVLAAIGVAGVREPRGFPRAREGVLVAPWGGDRLVPLLHPGQIGVRDTRSVPKNAAAGTAIAAAGCERWPLPVCSPDLNPIERVVADLKAPRRGAKARDPDALVAAIGAGRDQVTPAPIQAYDRQCGSG